MADQPSKKSNRRVRNPETFRERAIKAAENEDKPKRLARTRGGVSRVFGAIFRPIGVALRAIGNFAPIKLLRKIFRRPLRIVGKIIFPVYLRNSWKELRLVQWPSWRQSRQLTFAVLIFAIVFGATIALVDYGLDKVFRNILLK